MPGTLTPVCPKAGMMHLPLDEGNLGICSLNFKVFPYSLNVFSARTYYILAAMLGRGLLKPPSFIHMTTYCVLGTL